MKIFWLVAIILTGFYPQPSHAGSPDLQTPAPVIYLADNLDESQNLGWCIDTVGRGLSDRLHAHSCKPIGGDVQFKYDKSTRQIASATFANLCAEVKDTSFGLVKCSDNSPGQKFDYQNDTSEFHPSGNSSLCLAVGTTSRTAGPFMSRDLTLATCDSIEAKFKQWRIKE